jgi:hypothetical protein
LLSQLVANHPVAAKTYGQRFFARPSKSVVMVKLMAASMNPRDVTNFAQYLDEPLHGLGDNVRYDLLPNLFWESKAHERLCPRSLSRYRWECTVSVKRIGKEGTRYGI